MQGLTKSLIESPPTANGIQTSEREMATSVGYVLGFLIGGFLLSRFSRNFIMLLTLQVLGSMLVTVPWIASDWATDTVYIIIGVSLAILMIGRFWVGISIRFTFCLISSSSLRSSERCILPYFLRRKCHLLGFLGSQIWSLYTSPSFLLEFGIVNGAVTCRSTVSNSRTKRFAKGFAFCFVASRSNVACDTQKGGCRLSSFGPTSCQHFRGRHR